MKLGDAIENVIGCYEEALPTHIYDESHEDEQIPQSEYDRIEAARTELARLRMAVQEATDALERIDGSASTDDGAEYARSEAAKVLPALLALMQGVEEPPLKILVTVSGGVVNTVAVCGAPLGTEVIVHDYDEIENGDEPMSEQEFDMSHWYGDGQTVAQFLEQLRLENPRYRELV